MSEDQFCRLVEVPTVEALRQQYHAMRDLLARYRSLREDHLRYLIKCGLIRPVLRTNADTFFAFQDLALIKQANDSLAKGLSFRAVVRSLVAARVGQLAFDFRLDAAPAKILTLKRRSRRRVPNSPARSATRRRRRSISAPDQRSTTATPRSGTRRRWPTGRRSSTIRIWLRR